jgi:hypothetical protein
MNNEMNEETKDRLLRLWKQKLDKGTWTIFGGTFTVDGQTWQVVPMGKDQEPRFLKCKQKGI